MRLPPVARVLSGRVIRCSSAVLLLCLLTRPCPAQTQSTRDMREENQQLQTKVADLEKELEAARQRITDLESQLVELRRKMTTMVPVGGSNSTPGAPPPPPPPPPPVGIDESVPTASPRALFNAVVTSYETATHDVTRGRDGKPERANFFRVLDKWSGGARRQFAGPITWQVRIVDPERDLPAGREVELQAVDPKTGTALGETFMVALEKGQIERLWNLYDRRIEDRQALAPLELRGIAEAIITINPTREVRGTFDQPLFVGPFVEYSMRVTTKSLMPMKEEKPKPDSKAQPSKPAEPKAPEQPGGK